MFSVLDFAAFATSSVKSIFFAIKCIKYLIESGIFFFSLSFIFTLIVVNCFLRNRLLEKCLQRHACKIHKKNTQNGTGIEHGGWWEINGNISWLTQATEKTNVHKHLFRQIFYIHTHSHVAILIIVRITIWCVLVTHGPRNQHFQCVYPESKKWKEKKKTTESDAIDNCKAAQSC